MFLQKTRKIILTYATLLCVVILCLSGCKSANDLESKFVVKDGVFSISFLQLYFGDCTIIKFPNGKVVMIDCASYGEEDYNSIKDCLLASNVDKIDYYIFSHVLAVGNLKELAQDFALGKVFIPKVTNTKDVSGYDDTILTVKNKAESVCFQSVGQYVIEEEFFFTFLSPITTGTNDMIKDLEIGEITNSKVEYSSAIVYLEYANKRFIFGGDASSSAFDKVLELDKVDFYNLTLLNTDMRVNLSEIDLFKASKRGAKSGVNQNFYDKIKPKNCVVAVNKINEERYPDSSTITALVKSNPNVKILSTDVYGSFSVVISLDGKLTVE